MYRHVVRAEEYLHGHDAGMGEPCGYGGDR